jgi:Asp-tRNA(Asn)/Glu-tRNA(Gln) amidotransferase A subunit family amidase
MSAPVDLPPDASSDSESRRLFMAKAAAFAAFASAAALAPEAVARTSRATTAASSSRRTHSASSADGDSAGAAAATLTADMIAAAELLAGVSFTPAEREQMLRTVREQVALFATRAAFGELPNSLAPAQVFRVLLPGESLPDDVARSTAGPDATSIPPAASGPGSASQLDFATVGQLAAWMRGGHITSRMLVERAIARLRAADPTLRCVITLTAEQALAEADALDAEARRGAWRGPLHGIPYGLKDLFDTAGIATTWGAEPWRDRVPASDAIVVTRLRDAGAILVAKTAVGALAYGDIWFGGTCRSPWDPSKGSSGSSAGSASAVAAGCVPFAIGTETLGSIVSPCERCGTTGLRPTFGRVSREGCMALCWSWDKIGPITRCVTDTGLVLEAINGASMGDPSSVTVPFSVRSPKPLSQMRVAYDPAWLKADPASVMPATIAALRDAGVSVTERTMTPPGNPGILMTSLVAEAAAAFESMTRSGTDEHLSWQADEAWPNTFRQAWFVPAIELMQVERLRRRYMEWMRTCMGDADALLCPPFAGGMLMITNATGHPSLVQRAGFIDARTPTSLTLIGRPFDEGTLVSLGEALEQRLDVSRRLPDMPWMGA